MGINRGGRAAVGVPQTFGNHMQAEAPAIVRCMIRKRHFLVSIAVLSAFAVVVVPSQAALGQLPQEQGSVDIRAAVVDGRVEVAPVARPLSSKKLGEQLRDKMPYFVQEPTLVGNTLTFQVDISPMRAAVDNGPGLLDKLDGTVYIGRKGIDLRVPPSSASSLSSKLLLKKKISSRLVKTAGIQTISIALPKAVAKSLRGVPRAKLSQRVEVIVRDHKDIDPTVKGYERTQLTSSNTPPYIREYLAGQRNAVGAQAVSAQSQQISAKRSGAQSSWRSQLRALPMNQNSNTPGTMVIYNGSPFDLNVAANNVQCISGYLMPGEVGMMNSNTSVEFFQVAVISGDPIWFANDQAELDYNATAGMKSLEGDAMDSLVRASFLKNITGSMAKGLTYFASSLFFDITLKTVAALLGNNACAGSGSALNLTWTAENVGANQSAGNVNYLVPSYNRTGLLGSVRPTSVPAPAPGSPLNAYSATSTNGLAVPYAQLQQQLGSGGSVTLSTLNSNQQNGSYYGFYCNYRNQQAPNPNSSTNVSYGSSALGGGISPDWGPCNATSVTGSPDDLANAYGDSVASDLQNEGYTVLIGFSTTSTATAGPHPALPPQTAATSVTCLTTNAPCVYTVAPTATSANLIVGCTPGTWDMLTPWNGASPSMNLSSPPSAYNSSSSLSTQLAFTGVTASGAQVTDFVPGPDGGNVVSSFSPSTNNPFPISPAAMSLIQTSLGGPGSYVTQWHCVLGASTTLPAGINQLAPAAVAMNLVWTGTPVAASVANPAGNILSPPA